MKDITEITSSGLQVADTQVPRATNILSVQVGALEYAKELGIDLRYFLDNAVEFQNESFQAYLVEVLAENGINVTSLLTTIQTLFAEYNFEIAPEQQTTGLLAR
jgi:hypothetical protein